MSRMKPEHSPEWTHPKIDLPDNAPIVLVTDLEEQWGSPVTFSGNGTAWVIGDGGGQWAVGTHHVHGHHCHHWTPEPIPSSVPLPAAGWLLATALLGMVAIKRKR
jgi:hypothetical protein